MSRIEAAFRRLHKLNEAALIPYVSVGFPTVEVTRQLLPVIARQGADLIALGTPLSAVFAAQPENAGAGQAVSLADCISVAAEARRTNEIPLVFVSDYATMAAHGVLRFAVDAAGAGVTGLLVPDLPAEDAANFIDACSSVGMDLIGFVDPGAGDEEIARVVSTASGFIYCLAPGDRASSADEPDELEALVERVRRHTDLPLAVGHDANTPQSVARAARVAEGVVLGSELAVVIAAQPDDPIEIMLGVSDFIHEMKDATSRA